MILDQASSSRPEYTRETECVIERRVMITYRQQCSKELSTPKAAKGSKKLLTPSLIMFILCIDYIYGSGESMHIHLSYSNPVPLYRQIVDQIKEKILSGELPPGTPLPSIRHLAEEAMTSVITTKRAYSELENEGIIVTRPGLGSFVADFTYNDLGAIREESVNECIFELISTAKLVGISDEKLLDMVKEALKEETRRYERQ